MQGNEFFNSFQFDDNVIIDQQVQSQIGINILTVIDNWHLDLPSCFQASNFEFVDKARPINRFD